APPPWRWPVECPWRSSTVQEIGQQVVPLLGEYGFGMELNTLHRKLTVAHPHDLVHRAVLGLGPGGDFKAVREALPLDDEGVVAGRFKGIGKPPEDAPIGVEDRRGLAVHHLAGADHLATKGLADALVAEADAQQGDAPGKVLDGRHRDARLARGAGAGGDDDLLRRQGFDLVEGQFVVAVHPHIRTQLPQVLHHVVGEGIVVVDHQDHGATSPTRSPGSTIAAARKMALALFMVSFHSRAGTLSATIPPPAWTWSLPSLITAVRMAMAVSMLPFQPM